MRLPFFLEPLFSSIIHKEPKKLDDNGSLNMPVAPSVLLEQLGVKEYIEKQGCGFARRARTAEFDKFKPLFLGAANSYQSLPATFWTHHNEFGGLLMHGIEVAVGLIDRVRERNHSNDLHEIQDYLYADESLTTAVLLAYGLHHDFCNLLSGINIHVVDVKTHEHLRDYDPLQYSLSLYEFLIRQPTGVAYQWSFNPSLSLEPCTVCMRPVLESELRSCGYDISDEQISMLFDLDSPLRELLNELLVDANNTSINKDRSNKRRPSDPPHRSLEKALFYAATKTGLLDTAPVRLGAIFVSRKRLRRIGWSLPNFDEFFDLKHILIHADNPLAVLDIGAAGFRYYYPSENGYWLSSSWSCTRELLCLNEQRRARGKQDSKQHR